MLVLKRTPSRALWLLEGLVGKEYLEASIDNIEDKYITPFKGSGTRDVYLWGDTGVGKTYLMAAMIKEYICLGYECERLNFDDFCSKVRSTMNNNSTLTEYGLVGEMIKADKLFIDDIGLRSKIETDFVFVTFYTILNKRQERRLPTYITTNKSIDRLAETFDSRIASRLSTAVNIHMTGEDRRKKGN